MSDTTGAMPPLPKGLLTSTQVKGAEFARVMVVGAPKIGKTTALGSTAPRPLIINCDGLSATKGARRVLGDPIYPLETPVVVNRVGLAAALKMTEEAVDSGACRTVILDTLSILAESILADGKGKQLEGFDLWRVYSETLLDTYWQLSELPAHLFLVCHIGAPEEDGDESGLMTPLLYGRAKRLFPSIVDDVVTFDMVRGRKEPGERAFVLGQQDKWSALGRNVRRDIVLPPTVPALLQELGIKE